MIREMDTIQFEDRDEVRELLRAVDEYVKQNQSEKKNKTLQSFYDCLDVMDMTW